jgi:hypothetical protein
MATSLIQSTEPPAPAKPVMVLLEPEDRVSFDAERTELLSLLLPDEISSPQEYAAIAEDQGRVQAFIKRTKPSFDKVCDGAYRTWKDACGLRSLFFDGLDAFNTRARTLLGNYDQKQERIRREEERRLAEEERQREQQRINREAKLLEKQGQKEMANAVRQTPISAPAISLPSTVPDVKGLSFREDWKWRPAGGDSPEARAAAVKLVPREYLMLNEVALNALARGMKGTVKVPGIEFYCVKTPIRK